jgi:hypothetical protein
MKRFILNLIHAVFPPSTVELLGQAISTKKEIFVKLANLGQMLLNLVYVFCKGSH